MTFIRFVTGKSSGILSDISSGIRSGILSGISSCILLAYLLAFYLAYLLTSYLAFYLANLLAFYLANILALYLAYLVAFYLAYQNSFYLAYLLAFYLAYLLAFYLLTLYVAFYLAYLLAFYLTCYLAFYLAYLLAFYLAVEVQWCSLSSEGHRLRSSGAHWARKVPGWGPAVLTELGRSQVEVQRCPVRSDPCSWGPAVPTACGSWRRAWRRVGKAEVNMEVEAEVVEEKEEVEEKEAERRRRRRRRRRTTLIKSNNPHLAGGEIYNIIYIYILSIIVCIYKYIEPLDDIWWVSQPVRPDCGSALSTQPGASVLRAMVGVETWGDRATTFFEPNSKVGFNGDLIRYSWWYFMDFLAIYHWHSLAIIKTWFGCPCWGLVISPF